MFKGKNGEAYNIGNDENYVSMRELADMVRDTLKIKSEVESPQEYSSGKERIQNRMPDITKLRMLGFSPIVNLKEGLNRLRDYYFETKMI